MLRKSGSAELSSALVTVWENQSNVAIGFGIKSKEHRFARKSSDRPVIFSDPCGQTGGESLPFHSDQHAPAIHNPDTGNTTRTVRPEGPRFDRGAYR